jgi:hypothetical protein
MEEFVEGLVFHLFILSLSVFSLISDDIKYLFLSSDADPFFVIFNEVLFMVFLAELILNALYEKKFIGSFYFYLDIIALVSIMTDVQFIWGPIAEAIKSDDENANMNSFNPHLQRVNVASNASSA